MALGTHNNTIKTRIQLKSDTEENWKKSVLVADGGEKASGTSFVPLLGELIVFTADTTHPFSRLKIGDGSTNVVRLPFIDAGTINGDTIPSSELVILANYESFPQVGDTTKLYIDLSTNKIYCYGNTGYSQLSNFSYTTEKAEVSVINSWRAGTTTSISCSNGILHIRNGTAPTLNHDEFQAVINIVRGGN